MLRTTPTRIDLKTEDLREYEERKKLWPKQTTSGGHDHPQSPPGVGVDEIRMVRNTRIGYKQQPNH